MKNVNHTKSNQQNFKIQTNWSLLSKSGGSCDKPCIDYTFRFHHPIKIIKELL